MLRWPFHLLVVCSLLVACGVSFLWARSHTRCDSLTYYRRDVAATREQSDWFEIHSFPGCIGLNIGQCDGPPTSGPPYPAQWLLQSQPITAVCRLVEPADPFLWRHGFACHARLASLSNPRSQFGILLPHWLLILVLLLPPARWVYLHQTRWKRERQSRIGLCPRCSYDLRAHMPGQKCPECGTVIAPSDSAIITQAARSHT